ncbi:MAG: hypothetical protein K2F71_05915, partial [Paramuribaculum sp.]|nr:hypothetical protein [Paramuribaculum sp.]
MKQLILLFALLVIAAPAFSQGLDLRSRSEIRHHKIMKSLPKYSRQRQMMRQFQNAPQAGKFSPDFLMNAAGEMSASVPESTIAFVKIAEGFTADALIEAGLDVKSVYGDVAIVNIRMDEAEELSGLE